MIFDLKLSDFSFRCPICLTINCIRTRDQPSTGNLKVVIIDDVLPGYEKFETIEIIYDFR